MTMLNIILLVLVAWLYFAGRWQFSRDEAVQQAFARRPGHTFSQQVFLAGWPIVIVSYHVARVIFALSPRRRRKFMDGMEEERRQQPSPTKWV